MSGKQKQYIFREICLIESEIHDNAKDMETIICVSQGPTWAPVMSETLILNLVTFTEEILKWKNSIFCAVPQILN